jgi:hypothetical protein
MAFWGNIWIPHLYYGHGTILNVFKSSYKRIFSDIDDRLAVYDPRGHGLAVAIFLRL